MVFCCEEVDSQRFGGSRDVDQQGRAAVWAAAQAARFYGDVLGMPIRTGGGVVEVGVGLSVLLLDPCLVEPGAYHCAMTVPKADGLLDRALDSSTNSTRRRHHPGHRRGSRANSPQPLA